MRLKIRQTSKWWDDESSFLSFLDQQRMMQQQKPHVALCLLLPSVLMSFLTPFRVFNLLAKICQCAFYRTLFIKEFYLYWYQSTSAGHFIAVQINSIIDNSLCPPHMHSLCFTSLGPSRLSGTNLCMYFHAEWRAADEQYIQTVFKPNGCFPSASVISHDAQAAFRGVKAPAPSCWFSMNDHTRHRDLHKNWKIS